MKEKKKISPRALIPALLSLFLTAGTATVFHPCLIKEDGTWMHCHDVQGMVIRCGMGLTVLLLASALLSGKAVRAALYIIGIIGSAVIFLIPGTLMPMCMMQTMRCYTVMQPFVRITCVLTAAACLWQCIQTLRK